MMNGLGINACLRPLVACDGMTITTTEGVGNVRDGYSAVQDAIAKGNGSQCGFCTPGMVMNMHSLLATKPGATAADVEAHFDGNICRCALPMLLVAGEEEWEGFVHSCSLDMSLTTNCLTSQVHRLPANPCRIPQARSGPSHNLCS